MLRKVVLAPVPCQHLHSASGVHALRERVAFGSSYAGIASLPLSVPVFICASHPEGAPREALRLLCAGYATWGGTFDAVVRAVDGGRRGGKHERPELRPPSAEATDGPFQHFWEVTGLQPLATRRALADFRASGYAGEMPRWPIVAELDC